MAKLDRSRPIGDIYGTYDEKPLARYTQDGLFFDAKGNVILSEEEKAAEIDRVQAELAALNGDGEAPPTTKVGKVKPESSSALPPLPSL